MAQLAIFGHLTRGSEVITLLEMLGGINSHNLYGDVSFAYYTIDSNKKIKGGIYVFGDEEYLIFTLEQFEEKFPYKVGDKVSVYEYESEVRIDDMKWVGFEIQYSVFTDETEWYSAEELNKWNEPYKKETTEKVKDNWAKWDLPDGYEFQDKDGNIINTSVIKLVKKQFKYPKTYEECCEMLDCKANDFFTEFSCDGNDVEISDYENKIDDLLQNFRKLRYYRDAYWKISGEQMGLGKPWEPNWEENDGGYRYCIRNLSNKIVLSNEWLGENYILSFPTEEMRDAFYENFKDLIELCKELL